MPYLALIVTFAQRYDKNAGVGTVYCDDALRGGGLGRLDPAVSRLGVVGTVLWARLMGPLNPSGPLPHRRTATCRVIGAASKNAAIVPASRPIIVSPAATSASICWRGKVSPMRVATRRARVSGSG